MTFRTSMLAALLAGTVLPVQAADLYISASGGLSLQRDQSSLRIDEGAPFEAVEIEFDPGYVAAGSIGLAFDKTPFGRFRVEAELSYRENSADEVILSEGGEQIVDGDGSSLAGMAVFYYDFTDLSSRFTPFIGAGIGIAGVESDVVYAPASDPDGNLVQFGGPTETELAWQAIVGASIPFTDRIDFTLDGRFYSTGRPGWLREDVASGTVTGEFRSEFDAWHINAGVRFKF